jgi:Mce-associated membrane protein
VRTKATDLSGRQEVSEPAESRDGVTLENAVSDDIPDESALGGTTGQDTSCNPDALDQSDVDATTAPVSSSHSEEDVEPAPEGRRLRWPRLDPPALGVLVGALCVCVLAGMVSWLGVTAYHARAMQQQRHMFLQAGRQGALDLTTIRYTDVDSDVQRVLDGSTGKFFDEFKSRTADFAAAVRQAQSSSTGTVSEAGIENFDGDTAQVLVSVAVRTATTQAQDKEPRYWRMRVTVKKVDSSLPKVADVEFVP